MKIMFDFYTEVLGFKLIKDKDYHPEKWTRLKNGSFEICLHRSPKVGCEHRNKNKFVFQVDDVGKARDYLISKKVKMGKHHQWENCEACDGKDPEGNKFQVSKDR